MAKAKAKAKRPLPQNFGGYQQRIQPPKNPPPLDEALASLSKAARKTLICAQRYVDQHGRWPEKAVLRDLRGLEAVSTITQHTRDLTRAGFLAPGAKLGVFTLLRRAPDAPPVEEAEDSNAEDVLALLERALRPLAHVISRIPSDTPSSGVPIFTARDGVTVGVLRDVLTAHRLAFAALHPEKKQEPQEEPVRWAPAAGPLTDEEIREMYAETRSL